MKNRTLNRMNILIKPFRIFYEKWRELTFSLSLSRRCCCLFIETKETTQKLFRIRTAKISFTELVDVILSLFSARLVVIISDFRRTFVLCCSFIEFHFIDYYCYFLFSSRDGYLSRSFLVKLIHFLCTVGPY